MDDSISQKVAFLIEMFEDLATDFIEDLVSQNANYTLEQLVTECLNKNDQNQSNQNKQTEFTEMISLIPASTTSYFSVNETDDRNHAATAMELDTDHKQTEHHETNTLPECYKTFVETYSSNKHLLKIVDIHTHLCLMTEQYKFKYEARNQIQHLHSCIIMIHKLMQKIHQSPNMDKYRSIRESNAAFQKKIARIQGSKLLLNMCGWDYIQNTSDNNDGIYIFNSALNASWIQIVSRFFCLYIQYEIKVIKDTLNTNEEQDLFPIITEFPRKKRKAKNERLGKQTRITPKIKRLSTQQLREKRLKNLGNIQDKHYGTVNNTNNNIIGPIADGIIDLNAPNLRKELMQIAKKKHRKWINSRQARKRVFTLKDIEQLRKDAFDHKAKGPKVANEMDAIGREALKLTNAFRKQHGLSEVQWHQSLCEIGKVHSENMSHGKVPFGHHGFNERVKQYPFRTRSAAENVAMSQGLNDVARVAVDGWIQSPGHRKNLLSNHNYCGIGVYRGYNGAYYLTQLFALT